MEKLFEIKHLKKYYPITMRNDKGKKEKVTLKAVDDLTFNIFTGETLGVVGESGCGKSTLGRCLMKLIEPTGGEILFRGESLVTKTKKEMLPIRHDMQMVFQNPYSSFNPRHTLRRTLMDVAKFYGMNENQARERIYELLDCVNMDKTLLSRRSGELSGGQLQRLAIVRALIPNPCFIMADEPVSALDVSVQAQILNLLYDVKEQFGLTMMFISHELTVVEHICDRVLVMYLGAMAEIGVTEEIFGNTMHPYTKALIASKPREYPDEVKEKAVLEGEVPNATEIPAGCRFCTRCPEKIEGLCDVTEPPLYRVAERHWVLCHKAKEAAEKFQEGK